MTRIAIGAALSLFVATTSLAHADTEPDADVVAAATEANVSPTDLLGALNTLEDAGIPTSAQSYLIAAGQWPGLLQVTPAACGWPICGPLGQRLYCIEGYESHHTGAAVNRSSGASGWLQWLSGTARTWGVVVGNRASEWSAAARIAAQGERFFRSQWVPLQRGLC